MRAGGKKLAVTNGCFDLLHAGHVNYLAAARAQADALLVLVNSDRSVRELKGDGRPLNPQNDRALVLAALQSVDAVCIFDEPRATRLLTLAAPDIYVKGGDYSADQLPQEERDAVAQCGGRIVVLGHIPGRSTSALLEKLARL
ncbi:MAG: ADP-heptose synthase [Pedosphaera sp.]|nr:ADP-heptose synthase [Pedosphaera sp.]